MTKNDEVQSKKDEITGWQFLRYFLGTILLIVSIICALIGGEAWLMAIWLMLFTKVCYG